MMACSVTPQEIVEYSRARHSFALPAVASYKQQQLAVSYTPFVDGVTKQHRQALERMQHMCKMHLLSKVGQHQRARTDAT